MSKQVSEKFSEAKGDLRKVVLVYAGELFSGYHVYYPLLDPIQSTEQNETFGYKAEIWNGTVDWENPLSYKKSLLHALSGAVIEVQLDKNQSATTRGRKYLGVYADKDQSAQWRAEVLSERMQKFLKKQALTDQMYAMLDPIRELYQSNRGGLPKAKILAIIIEYITRP